MADITAFILLSCSSSDIKLPPVSSGNYNYNGTINDMISTSRDGNTITFNSKNGNIQIIRLGSTLEHVAGIDYKVINMFKGNNSAPAISNLFIVKSTDHLIEYSQPIIPDRSIV